MGDGAKRVAAFHTRRPRGRRAGEGVDGACIFTQRQAANGQGTGIRSNSPGIAVSQMRYIRTRRKP